MQAIQPPKPQFLERQQLKCPRCYSMNFTFYVGSSSLSLRRRFCKDCGYTNIPISKQGGVAIRSEFCSSIRTSLTNKESAKPRNGPRDIAWQHGVSIDNGKKSCCKYCEKVMQSGGATRLKQHLAGGFTNVAQCLQCPPQVRTTMVKLLKRGEEYRLEKEREKGAFQPQLGRSPYGDQHVDDDEDNDLDVQRLQDASSVLPLTAQSSYEVGDGSTQSAQSSQDDGGYTSSRALNIKSYYGSSKIVKPMHMVKKGPWTCEEDQILISYIQQYGCGNWQALPALAGLRRSSKSCRLRWTKYLEPEIKIGDFTREEEATISMLYGSLGNKWSEIAARLPGRTETQIKNVWNTRLIKRLIRNQDNTVEEPSVSVMSGSDVGSMSSVSHIDDNTEYWVFPEWSQLPPVSDFNLEGPSYHSQAGNLDMDKNTNFETYNEVQSGLFSPKI